MASLVPIEKIEQGEIVDTELVEYEGEIAISQTAEEEAWNSIRELLITGGRVLQNINPPKTPQVKETNYSANYAEHILELIEGNEPESEDDWKKVAQQLEETYSIETGFQKYGQLRSTHENQELKLSQEYENWNEMLVDRMASYRNAMLVGKAIDKDYIDQIYEAWSIEEIPESPTPSIIHNDLKPENILIDDSETPVMLDWDQALIGDPYLDLVILDERLRMEDIDSESLRQEYGLGQLPQDREKSYRAYTLANEGRVQSLKERNGEEDQEEINKIQNRIEDL